MFQDSSSEKKLVKPLQNCSFGPNLHRTAVIMDHAQDGKIFFDRNNNSRSSAFRKFLFYQNSICFDWVINIFLSWVMFSVKKLSFPVKTAVNLQVLLKLLHKMQLNSFLTHKVIGSTSYANKLNSAFVVALSSSRRK